MKNSRQDKLRAAGFKVGSVREFLQLSDEDAALIEMKVRLVTMLKSVRENRGVSQQQLAALMGSSQSRIAKLEGSCVDASLDLICRALFAMGVSSRDIGRTLAGKRAA